MEDIEKAVTDQLKAILVSDYQRCYEDWEQRLRRFVASQGNYFGGDKLDLLFKSKYRVIFNQSHYFISGPWIFESTEKFTGASNNHFTGDVLTYPLNTYITHLIVIRNPSCAFQNIIAVLTSPVGETLVFAAGRARHS